MLHSLLKFWCKISLYFFFRKCKINFHSKLPDAPIIFLANHPNAFLDAILIACNIDQKPWFLTRGEVFKSKWSAWILSQLRLIPIFRFRDGHDALRKNEDIINKCANLLQKDESILLFPEGDNSLKGNLLPLQKGFVRIADVALKLNSTLNLQIVPVGINYHLTKGFGGTILLNVGAPYRYADFAKDKTTEQILNSMWNNLNVLLATDADNPSENQTSFIKRLNKIYFTINNFILRLVIRLIVSFIKEDPMKNSVRFAAGMLLSTIIYLIQALVVGTITGSWMIGVLYVISILVSLRFRIS